MIETLFTILLMSLTCLGVWLSMQEGNILWFLRSPALESMKKNNEYWDEVNNEYTLKYHEAKNRPSCRLDETCIEVEKRREQARLEYDHDVEMNAFLKKESEFIYKFLKPFILCVWCFASFWGSLVFFAMHYFYFLDLSTALIPIWIISVFACTFLNALLDGVLHKMDVL
jgi:hypothetical protein